MSASPAVLRASPASSFGFATHHAAGLALAPPREPVPRDSVQQPTISLLLERRDESAAGERFTSLAVAPGETIKSVKLRVAKRSAFTSRHCLVLGDRELLEDDVTVGELAVASAKKHAAASNLHLHIVCKLKDIESVSIATSMDRTLTFRNEDMPSPPIRRSKSALTALLADNSDRSDGSPTGKQLALMRRSPSLPPDGVVHLIIRKSGAGLHWRHAPGAKLELSISADATVEDVAAELEAADDLPANQHLLMYNGEVLAAGQSLASYGIGKDFDSAVLELVPLVPPGSSGGSDGKPSSSKTGSPPLSSPEHGLFVNWRAAQAGLASGLRPQLAASGSGGSYFLRGADGDKVALFKPADEEPFGANNPRHMGCSPDGHGLRKGIRPGEGAIREVAAYVLDHGHFAGVPPTAMVTCQPHLLPGSAGGSQHVGSAKVGSLQQFVSATTDCEEQGPSAFPVREVHKIAQLDMRLANADRNGGNILATKDEATGSWTLTPIDHGYTLPSSLQDICFEWLNWPQAHVPFDEEMRAYIAALDAEADLATLAEHGLPLRSDCKRVFRAATLCLQLGAAAGLTPYAIGNIMCRELRMKSPLEKLHSRALQLARGQSALAVSSSPAGCGFGSIDGFFGAANAHTTAGGKTQDQAYFEALESLLREYISQLGEDSILDGVSAA